MFVFGRIAHTNVAKRRNANCAESNVCCAACAYPRSHPAVCDLCGQCPVIGGLCVARRSNGCV